MTTTAEALKEMMEAWNKIMATARAQFPAATEEEIYQIVKGAMNRAIEKEPRLDPVDAPTH